MLRRSRPPAAASDRDELMPGSIARRCGETPLSPKIEATGGRNRAWGQCRRCCRSQDHDGSQRRSASACATRWDAGLLLLRSCPSASLQLSDATLVSPERTRDPWRPADACTCGDFLKHYEGIDGYERFGSGLALMYFPTFGPGGTLEGFIRVPTMTSISGVNRARGDDVAWLAATLAREGRRFGTRVVREVGDTLVVC